MATIFKILVILLRIQTNKNVLFDYSLKTNF